MREKSFTSPRRKTKIGVALAVGLGLLVVPTAMPASADSNVSASAEADTTIAGTAFSGMGLNDPVALLTFDSNLGLALRYPEVAGTPADADTRNANGPEPTLTCHEGVTTTAPAAMAAAKTITGVGRYASDEGNLILYFYMMEPPTSAVDVCVMANSDYVAGASKFVFTAAGAKAAYGDPTALVNAAKAELEKVKTAAAKLYKKSGEFAPTNTLRTQLRRALGNQKIFIRPSGEYIDSANNVHLMRSDMTSQKMTAAVRLPDTRLVTMVYDGAKKKTSFSVTPENFDSNAKPSTTKTTGSKVTGQALSKPTNKYYLPGGTVSATSGARISGYSTNAGWKEVYLAVSTTRGTLTIPTYLHKDLKLPYGYTSYSGSQVAVIGGANVMEAVLRDMTLTTPAMTYSATDKGLETTISITAFENRDDIAYNPANQHFYKFVSYGGEIRANSSEVSTRAVAPKEDRTAVKAEAAANASVELGLTGYLATITSAAENDFVSSKIQGASNVWINGSDTETEGVWKFTGGPEKGQNFWNGCGAEATPAGSAPAGAFARWNTPDKEPNNYLANGDTCEQAGQAGKQATAGEDCMVTNWKRSWIKPEYWVGYWNDLPCDSPNDSEAVQGYVVEYGNKSVGGDFVNIDIVSNTLIPVVPAPKQIAPNFFKKAATFLGGALKPKPFKAPAFLQKLKPKVSKFVKVDMKMKFAEAGTYSVSIKRQEGKGIPFAMQAGTTYKIQGGKLSKPTAGERWNLIIVTQKDNQTVTVSPILVRAMLEERKATTKNIKATVRLVATKKAQENQMCLANWCQGVTIPVVKG